MKKRIKVSKANILLAASALLSIAAFILLFGDGSLLGFGELFSQFDQTQDFVKILNVGEADSILIYSNGQAALIDTGDSETVNEVCYDLAACRLKKLDVLLITHLHMDHAGGVDSIAERFTIENLILPHEDETAEANTVVNAAKQRLQNTDCRVYTAAQGMYFDIGEFEVTVLAYFPELGEQNNSSILTMVKIGETKFLLTGDAEGAAEMALLHENLDLRCDVLKVGHHGSHTSSSEAFLKAAHPIYAAISVGNGNRYSHPDYETLSRLQKAGAEIYRTDQNGDITFYVEQGNLRVKTEK